MKIHYFQRYHTKENVSTANTMLLLSRLYQYSPIGFSFFSNSSATRTPSIPLSRRLPSRFRKKRGQHPRRHH